MARYERVGMIVKNKLTAIELSLGTGALCGTRMRDSDYSSGTPDGAAFDGNWWRDHLADRLGAMRLALLLLVPARAAVGG